MPTAVEHPDFEFLKLDIDTPGHQRQLDVAFQKIDDDFLKLTNSDLTTDEFLKYEHKFSPMFLKIGHAYMQTGQDFLELARAGSRMEELVNKLNNADSGGATPTAAPTGGLQDDFLTLDADLKLSGQDLKLFGRDFIKLDRSASLDDFNLKLTGLEDDATKLSTDMLADKDDFNALSDDFLKLGGDDAQSADYKLGELLGKIADDFASLSDDFTGLNGALSGESGQGSQDLLGPIGGAFSTLNTDFLKLSADLTSLGGPVSAVIGDLLQKGSGGHDA